MKALGLIALFLLQTAHSSELRCELELKITDGNSTDHESLSLVLSYAENHWVGDATLITESCWGEIQENMHSNRSTFQTTKVGTRLDGTVHIPIFIGDRYHYGLDFSISGNVMNDLEAVGSMQSFSNPAFPAHDVRGMCELTQ